MRIAEIREDCKRIEGDFFQPGKAFIPHKDAHFEAWNYGKASNWVTLWYGGGYDDQPQLYLEDMDYFNTIDYYYSIRAEETRLVRILQKG